MHVDPADMTHNLPQVGYDFCRKQVFSVLKQAYPALELTGCAKIGSTNVDSS